MFERVVASLPAEVLQEFRQALRLGKWSNGLTLTPKQKQTCEQALKLIDEPVGLILH